LYYRVLNYRFYQPTFDTFILTKNQPESLQSLTKEKNIRDEFNGFLKSDEIFNSMGLRAFSDRLLPIIIEILLMKSYVETRKNNTEIKLSDNGKKTIEKIIENNKKIRNKWLNETM